MAPPSPNGRYGSLVKARAREKRRLVRRVPCEECDAPSGRFCTRPSGSPRKPHMVRTTAHAAAVRAGLLPPS